MTASYQAVAVFWLIDQTSQDEEAWLREAQFFVLVVLHTVLPVIC